MVVPDGDLQPSVGHHLGPAAIEVQAGQVARDHLGVAANRGQGRHYVAHLNHAGRHLRQQRGERLATSAAHSFKQLAVGAVPACGIALLSGSSVAAG
jgi:hypothetical protein